MTPNCPRQKSNRFRIGWPLWLSAALVLFIAVGCTVETIPAANEAQERTPAVEQASDTPATKTQADETATGEPAPEAETTDTATAEALRETLESALLEATTQSATVTPLLEEVLQLQPTSAKPSPEALQRINFAKNDLAERLDVEPATIEVVAYEKAIWRDGSLGCPQPDMMYTQALVDGYLIQLRVDGQTYNYHGANGRDPFLCTDNPETTNSPPGIQRDGSLADPPGEDE